MTFVRLVSFILLCSIVPLAGNAQPANAESEATVALLRAADQMSSSARYWQQEQTRRTLPDSSSGDKSDRSAASMHCGAAQQAIDLFVRFAPQAAMAQSYERIRDVYASYEVPLPASLAAAKPCRNDGQGALSSSDLSFIGTLTGTLAVPFRLTAETQEAAEKLGPVVADPARYRAVTPPATGVELLRNLKWVVDNDVVLRPDFYVPDSLRRVLGIDAFVIRQRDGGLGLDHWVRPTKEEQERSPDAAAKYAKCQYGGLYTPQPNGASQGGLTFDCSYARSDRASIEQIEKTFGADWLFLPPSVPSHGSGLPAATAAHGNERLHRESKRGRKAQRVTIQLWPDATLRSFTLDETEQ
ncbi:MAG: hypothetical protein J0J01_17720 [Reyranella sp.]|uniref:hypothetical protein n=1 Tax=Reyranella sp. TaxID=1929291 RepID=UPI001AC992D3|nr:hypothetical protein [Reyranella sp.]MBN9088746.1 hypothetical protein [Reyranella sp.]